MTLFEFNKIYKYKSDLEKYGFSEVWEIPKVSDDVWQEALNISANCYEDGKFIVKDFRTNEELLAYELDQRKQEATSYLAQTDWVNTYKLKHDLGLELIPEDSSKWIVISKREEYLTYLKGI